MLTLMASQGVSVIFAGHVHQLRLLEKERQEVDFCIFPCFWVNFGWQEVERFVQVDFGSKSKDSIAWAASTAWCRELAAATSGMVEV